ncbi:MAG: hypothetical protein H7X91_06260 [Burkholderiales bacterium]|nr:hypothetical protein [Burkholderiales bacterium]
MRARSMDVQYGCDADSFHTIELAASGAVAVTSGFSFGILKAVPASQAHQRFKHTLRADRIDRSTAAAPRAREQ